MRHPATPRLLDLWYGENLRWTTNDQISLPFVLAVQGTPVCSLPNDIILGHYPNQQSSVFIKHTHGL